MEILGLFAVTLFLSLCIPSNVIPFTALFTMWHNEVMSRTSNVVEGKGFSGVRVGDCGYMARFKEGINEECRVI
jgi:hypothetical protein